MSKALRVGLALTAAGACITAYGGTTASATIKLVSTSGGVFNYDLDLTNTGTTNIGTFWFSWVPGKDFMQDKPTNVVAPTGWSVNAVTHGGSTDGYAIRWLASTALTPGGSLDGFMFSSVDSLTMLEGNSPFYTGFPVLTSFVYEGGPFQGGSDQFTATAPAPTSMFAGAIALAGTFFRRRKRV